jgi:hypothetical protein
MGLCKLINIPVYSPIDQLKRTPDKPSQAKKGHEANKPKGEHSPLPSFSPCETAEGRGEEVRKRHGFPY